VGDKAKLIEVALPLEVINRESAREKSIRQGHPSTLHLWWARRPLAAARAVLFAQLVDDPSANPEQFPTEQAQKDERERLHRIIERLVVWENINDQQLLNEAKIEIFKSTDGHPPPVLDPFAGGGTIPLEAQRLGLEAHASDLNPVAVLINKALIEIPPIFRNKPPVFPGLAESETAGWQRARGLAADVYAYSDWMRGECEKRVGHMYPKVTLPTGKAATPMAWVWARTVRCPNPACKAEVPLVSSMWLARKKGKEAFLVPEVEGSAVNFTVGYGPEAPISNKAGQGAKFSCWCCGSGLDPETVHAQLDVTPPPPARLLAVVAVGDRKRIYLAPTESDREAARAAAGAAQAIRETDGCLLQEARGTFGGNAQGRRYGFFTFADYFTDRQLVTLTTFSDLVSEARERVLGDALAAGLPLGDRLVSDGCDAAAYADAVAVYLALIVSRLTDYQSSLTTWASNPQMEILRNTFSRQAISMSWDFAEGNPFADSSGSFHRMTAAVCEAMRRLPANVPAQVRQSDAVSVTTGEMLVSTDPPYYDNIVYSDLSDFFYVWLRRTLKEVEPDLFATLLVPKSEELVANAYRHGGKDGARNFFEEGFRNVFKHARESAMREFPVTVYYAFKQSAMEDEGASSTGWETLLEGMVRNGWMITSTWPLRTESAGRMISIGTNALASSIVLSLRPRPETATMQDRRGFIDAMKAEMGPALQKLQAGGVAPVDLPQAAIGPGMAVFSRYSAVLEPDGSSMTVRAALARINEVLDEVLSEQEGDFDPTTRFAIAWFRTHGYGEGKFGNADDLARARNTAVSMLERAGILAARKGVVRLYRPSDLSEGYDVITDESCSAWEVLHHLIRIMESEGVPAAGAFLAQVAVRADGGIDAELIPELAHLLFRIAEDNKWTKDAISFNSLVTAWPDIVDASRAGRPASQQVALDFSADDSN
jgi:putative DNA methylase